LAKVSPPKAEIIHPITLIPPKAAREAGNKKIPEPIILPNTKEVAPQRPIFLVVVVCKFYKINERTRRVNVLWTFKRVNHEVGGSAQDDTRLTGFSVGRA